MSDVSFTQATKIYDIMSKLASNAAMSSAMQTIALIQKAMADSPSGSQMRSLAGGEILTAEEAKILDEFDGPTLNAAWRKVIRSVDIAVAFVPELDRSARTEALLVRPGDKIKGAPQDFANVQANWEVEIDLGIIRGKVSW